ncbi:MAG: rhomboid family intramembrane serine protease, partial [Candidatus Angelobacter sp.]
LGTYPVTTALMAINIIAYVGQLVSGQALTFWGTNIGPLTLSGEYWRLFTAGFLHGGILHIAVNMWCLWSLGRLSERLFGKWQTFAIYMLTGVGGALLSIASDPNHGELGASGAVFGLVGAVMAGVKFGDLNISAGEKRAIFSSAVSFAILNFILGFSGFGSSIFGRVDNMCHLGGFISGLLVGLPLGAFARHNKLLQVGTLVITSMVVAAGATELVQQEGPAAKKTAAAIAWHQRNYPKAVHLLEQYTVAKPQDDDGLVFLGEAYLNSNEPEKAIGAFEQALRVNPNSEDAKQALEELRSRLVPEKK